jgi:hypothetical protein
VLAQIFPLVSPLSLSLDALNTTSFNAESKDEDLHAGRLQLPKKSILLISEGAVREGSINNKGTTLTLLSLNFADANQYNQGC